VKLYREINESYVPYVVETSIGLDRMFLTILSNSYKEETLENGESRIVLKIPHVLAPHKVAVLPLTNKDGMPETAREIIRSLQLDFKCLYEEKDSIGKRYRRQDAIGTPFCVTVDHQTLEDGTVTLRNRDSMKQKRVLQLELHAIIAKEVSLKNYLN
jgi:glycyl-tRNA synthetase